MFRLVMGLAVALLGIGAATLRDHWHGNGQPVDSPAVVAELLKDAAAQPPADPAQPPVSLELQLSQIRQILEQEVIAAAAAERAAAGPRDVGPAVIAVPQGGCGLDGSTSGAGCGTVDAGDGAAIPPAGPVPTTGPESAAQVRVFRPRQ